MNFEIPPGAPAPVCITVKQKPSAVAEGGTVSGQSSHVYVRLSALPDEMRKHVVEAVKAIAQMSR